MNEFWEKAEALKPSLIMRHKAFRPDASLSVGESVVIDCGRHFVGYAKFNFSFSEILDSPLYLQVQFAEHANELKEDCENYCGWIAKGWIQVERIHIDDTSKPYNFGRRYAFRYVKITVLSAPCDGKTEISKLNVRYVTSAAEKIQPCGQTKREKRIDEISLFTLSECMQTVFEDGPKRDRRLWLGDLRLQALTDYQTFKHNGLVKRCLYLFAGSRAVDGRMSQSVFTQKYLYADKQTNFDYPLLFVATLRDYYFETADKDVLKDLLPIAKEQIELSRKFFDGDVIRDGEIGWCFLDWSLDLNRQAGAQAVYLYSERALIELMQAANQETAEYEKDLQRKTTAAMECFFDEHIGLAVSGKDRQVSYASNVWFVLAKILPFDKCRKVLKRLTAVKEIVKPVTPYMMHHYVQALIDCGLFEEARTVLNDYWGGMVDKGADTFWELYNEDDPNDSPYGGTAVHSYCHAWSCTPSYFLRKYFRTL